MNISQRDSKIMWHPYTPMKAWPEAIAMVRGEGVYLVDEQGNRYVDAISSWWVCLHGHGNKYIAQKVAEQMTTMEHCMFAGFTHEPAVRLGERLLHILPDMSRIFYSDNGSTAVEVAMKMAIQYWRNKGMPRKRIVAIEGAYHGDTFGAMAVSGRSVFTEAFTELLFDVTFIPFPERGNEAASISALDAVLAAGDVAAFIAEPLVQGSAGMRMYDAATLERYFALCKRYGALIIDDEVMTGFGRTGTLFACDQVSTRPDIICLSKGITGGVMPLGVTATTAEVFDAFYDDDRSRMLYHGHSFTANATACAASLASMDLLLHEDCTTARRMIVEAHAAFAVTLAGHGMIADIRQAGTILAIELRADTTTYHSALRDAIYRFFIGKKMILRPLGNVVYILPPYCITKEELAHVYTCIQELLTALENGMLL
ncbi:adenosylmethionine--8-amino-7-oxononanoate transaminase [Nemorincola caseinilytica]|uniref:Adenosylmethionine-8-amino-7-oxononanoate aminotransferase n=1 Tax=Nemorincola caseinilytica TaxID=2054315 RepID=A0ABP8N9Y7_9BACT